MIVAVQKGLGRMKDELRSLGFDTVDYGEYKFPVDAVVYKGVTSSVMMNAEPHGSPGVFLVDCADKSPAEVAQILRRRLYTPLF